MRHSKISFLALAIICCFATIPAKAGIVQPSFAATDPESPVTPSVAASPYDGLLVMGAESHLVDWASVARDKRVKYVYLNVPSAPEAAYLKARKLLGLDTPEHHVGNPVGVGPVIKSPEEISAAADSMLVDNMRAAVAHGLEVGLCFPFVDTLSRVMVIRTMLRDIPVTLSTIAPMIDLPGDEAMDSHLVHRRIQIWSHALETSYKSKPVLKASREVCKSYLAPVLSTIYPICLVHPDGPGMRQYPSPYTGGIPVLPQPGTTAPSSGIIAYPIWVKAD